MNSKLRISLAVILIILMATFLRLYELPDLPPGLNFDEAGNGVAALDILHGAPRLWWRIGGGKEPLWPYLIALSTTILGNASLTLRLPAAIVGILTVAAVYPLTHQLFRPTGRFQAQMIALFAMSGLALSEWHLHFSRLGFRAILLPLLSTLGFYFFWRGLVSGQWLVVGGQWSVISSQWSVVGGQWPVISGQWPVISGQSLAHRGWRSRIKAYWRLVTGHWSLVSASLFLALAIYAYLAARLLPFVLILFFLIQWFIYRQHPKSNRSREKGSNRSPLPAPRSALSTSHFPFSPYFYLFASLILFLSPLIIYFLLNPADFAARSTTVSIFNPAWNNGDLPGTVWHTLTTTLSTFIGLNGDANPLVNLPGQPALSVWLAPFFLLGLITSLANSIRAFFPAPPPPRSSVPYLFLLCWWIVMLLPAILAPEGAPHHLRLIGTLVPTYIFVAVGFVTTINSLTRLLSYASRLSAKPPCGTPHASRIVYLLPATCYLLVALQTYTNYFIHWPASADFTLPFDLYAVRLADDIARAPSHSGYVLPMDIRAGTEARHYTLDYLLDHRRPSAYAYLPVDERNTETVLTRVAADHDELRLVRWTQDKHRQADAKELVTYLLETNARRLGRESLPVYDVESYALPAEPDFRLPTIDRPVGVTLDGLLRIEAAFLPALAASGDWLPVAITFAPLAPMKVDYKASLRLMSPAGERVAQKDRVLLHNFHQGTSLWPPETVNEYYLLPIPPDTLPGNYTVAVVIYQPDTQAPLVADGVVEVPIGQVSIE